LGRVLAPEQAGFSLGLAKAIEEIVPPSRLALKASQKGN
jgi:hypothetical protein